MSISLLETSYTHGICEKSLSYASSTARAMLSEDGKVKAGGSCKSCKGRKNQ